MKEVTVNNTTEIHENLVSEEDFQNALANVVTGEVLKKYKYMNIDLNLIIFQQRIMYLKEILLETHNKLLDAKNKISNLEERIQILEFEN